MPSRRRHRDGATSVGARGASGRRARRAAGSRPELRHGCPSRPQTPMAFHSLPSSVVDGTPWVSQPSVDTHGVPLVGRIGHGWNVMGVAPRPLPGRYASAGPCRCRGHGSVPACGVVSTVCGQRPPRGSSSRGTQLRRTSTTRCSASARSSSVGRAASRARNAAVTLTCEDPEPTRPRSPRSPSSAVARRPRSDGSGSPRLPPRGVLDPSSDGSGSGRLLPRGDGSGSGRLLPRWGRGVTSSCTPAVLPLVSAVLSPAPAGSPVSP